MNKRTSIALLAVVLFVVPGFALADVSGSPSLSAYFSDGTVAPGEETTVDLVIVNEGELDEGSAANPSLNGEVTQARGLTAEVESGDAPFTVRSGTQGIGTLPEGATNPIPVSIVVDDDAEPGTYDVPVSVSYTYTSEISEEDGSRDEESVTRTLDAEVTVEEAARIGVVDVSSDVAVGSTGTVAVTVENAGSMAANRTQLSLASDSADVAVGESGAATRYVGSWEPGERRTVRYRVTATDDADAEPYAFTVSGSYEEPNGRDRGLGNVAVGVDVGPEQTFAVDDVNSTLRVGDEGQLSGVVTNTGNRTVDDLVLAWDGDQRNIDPTETEYAVGTLEPGESAEFDFDVEVSDAARSGPRQFSLVARYDDDQGNQHSSDPIAVRQQVGPASDEFDVEVVHANVSAGESSTVELRLTNTADEALSDVSAKLFADAPLSTSDDEAYVQSLAPGDSTSVVFAISADAGALEKTYPLSMDFQYDEPDGDTVTTDTYRVPVQVVTESDDGGFPLAVAGVLVLAGALGVGLFFRYR